MANRLHVGLCVLGLLAGHALAAQAIADSSKKAAANPAGDSTEAPARKFSAGVSTGQLRFADGSQERALGASVAAHLWGWIDISLNPTYAWARGADTTVLNRTIAGKQVAGFTDLPIEIGVSHELPGGWSPSLGFSLGITLPTGDSATVGGGGATAVGGSFTAGVTPATGFSLSLGAGHTLTNGYSSGLATSSTTSLSFGSSVQIGTVGMSAGYSADVGEVQPGFENARSLSGGLSIPLFGDYSLSLDGSGGLTHGAPDYAVSVGIGTTVAGIASVTVPTWKKLQKTFGAGRKFPKTKPKTKPTKKPAGG